MKLKLEHIIIVAMFGFIMFQSMCGNKDVPVKEGKTIIKRFTDTIVKVDTVVNEITKHHYDLRVDTVVKSVIDSSLNAYVFNEDDSLLNATITVHSAKLPYLDFEYKMKHFETIIEKTIKDSVVVEVSKSYLNFGAAISSNGKNLGLIPRIGYTHKSGMAYDFGYDVLNKNMQFGFSKRFSLKRRGLFN